ncbi:MAG: hypothetical protein J6V49_04085 [Bacteroidales bacterium]|nr:hypothetical protein [Bacteroidales bacterium]MBO5768548.1 hypothetical protein [Bacteroidales bacterium]MBO5819089.1 hypothetical protein [Bacteroidales bacterium]MBO5916506.1 hypothetical protein [Bacteroidales bacterium]MBO5978023.1 hypothetical protein [Bacteroidales bacterium]
MRKVLTTLCLFVSIMSMSAASISPKVPMNNQENVAVNAQIVVQASSALVQGSDSCFLNGEYLPVTSIASNMAIFKPGIMDYATDYEFVVRDGAFLAKDGSPMKGCTIRFRTTLPKAKLFDAVVAKDGSGDYTSIRAAVKAAPNNRTEPWIIFVKNGTYEELVRVNQNQPYITLVGEDINKTILKFSITSNAGHERDNANFREAEGQGPVLVTNAPNFYLHNMTVINSWGYEKQAGPQALALGSYADRFVMFNANLKSYQDTWQTGRDEHRHYARRSYIEGAVDFIYCSGDMVLDSCTLGLCRDGSVIVAPSHGAGVQYGYVFRDTKIVSSKPGVVRTKNSYGRPWHYFPRASFINTTWSKDIYFTEAGWTDHMGGLPVVFAEYNTRNHKGEVVDLSRRNTYYYTGDRNNPTATCTAKAVLSKEEADALNVRTVLRGKDGWTPDKICQELPAPVVTYKDNVLTWTKEDRAICYIVMRNGECYQVTTETTMAFEGDVKEYSVRAVSYYGTLGHVSSVPFVDGIQAEKAVSLDARFDGEYLHIGQLSAKATVEFVSLDGRVLSLVEASSNSRIPVAGAAILARIRCQDEVCVLKCIR